MDGTTYSDLELPDDLANDVDEQVDVDDPNEVGRGTSDPSPGAAGAAVDNRNSKKRQRLDSFRWTPELIEQLLNARQKFHSYFVDAKNKTQLGEGWNKIR